MTDKDKEINELRDQHDGHEVEQDDSLPKYPEITIQMTGEDGNGMLIVSRAARLLMHNEVDREEVDAFRAEALGGDYDHLLRTIMRWMNTE